jgi:type I restriction enzyme S subunit
LQQLYYYLGSDDYTEYLISRTEGAAYPAFNPDVLIKSELTLPPLPIQKKIAKVLGDLDDKIELNRRMNETLEEMAMAVYRHYFVNFGLPPGAKEEATECPFGKLIEHPEMGMIPEGWSVGKFSDFFEINPTRQLTKDADAPYLEMSNVSKNSPQPIGWVYRKYSSGMKFINGDTLFARITPCLEHWKKTYVDFLPENIVGWGSTEFIVIRSKKPLPLSLSYL